MWTGLGLGLNNFDAVQPTDRAKAVAISSVVNAIGWTMGTVIGSWLISTVPVTLQIGTVTLELVSNPRLLELPLLKPLRRLSRRAINTPQ